MIDNHKYIEIHKYLTNQSDQAERAVLEAWINASAENKSGFEQIKTIWVTADKINMPSFDAEHAWAKNKKDFQLVAPTTSKIYKLQQTRWIAVAASLIFVFATWMLWPAKSSNSINYATTSSVLKVSLQDESLVFLDQNSNLSTNDNSSVSRKVSLHGRAIFEVTKSTIEKFEVESKDFNVIVYGTSFIVDTDRKSVKVIEGKVLVKTKSQEIFLTANQSAQINNDQININTSDTISEKDLFFNHSLSFANVSLDIVFENLGTFFNTKFELPSNADPKSCMFTSGSLHKNTLDEVMQILKITFGLDYSISSDKKVVITKIRCPQK